MAQRQFKITAVMQLKGPTNIKSIVDDINRQLAGVKVNIAVNMPTPTISKIQKVSTTLKQVSVAAKKAETDLERFGAQIARSIERYGAFTVATTGFITLISKISSGISETIKFQRELVRIAQVSGQTLNNLKGLSDEVTRLSKAYGVSSNVILESAVTLSQAGLSAKNVKIALESLAQTGVASTFGDIKDTTEASIAAMQQFGYETKDLGKLLSSINKVSAQFAVESEDITTAIRRAGSAFQAAGGDMHEFLGVVTAVRQTTRESAETISTGLRTIFARLQRPKTQNFLKSLGIDVLNDKNQFVGGYEAIKRISEALKQIPSTDVRYARVAEEVAGIRQINKFIPLIEKFDIAEKAVNVSIRSSTSLMDDAKKAQEAWAVQIERVNQAFLELLRTFANNNEVKLLAGVIFNMAESFLKLATSLETVLPYLVAISSVKITQGLGGISSGFSKEIFKGKGFATGGVVGGAGNRDSEPAFLTPGEYVIKKSSVRKIGKKALDAINNGQFEQFSTGGGYNVDDDGITGKRKTKQESSNLWKVILSAEYEDNKSYRNKLINDAYRKWYHEGDETQFAPGGLFYSEPNKSTYPGLPQFRRRLPRPTLQALPTYQRDVSQYNDSDGSTDYLYPSSQPPARGGGSGRGTSGGFGFQNFGFPSFGPGAKKIGNAATSASNYLGENGLGNFFILSSLNALSDATLGTENAFTQLTKVLTVTVGQFSILTQLFNGLSSSAQFIGESSYFGGTFTKAGQVAEATKGKVFRDESRKLSSIALGERFGLTGGQYDTASISDLVQTTRLSKSQQNTAYRNYAIDEFLAKNGQTRGGRSYNDIEAAIKSDPKLTREFNKIKRTLTDSQKNQALQNAQLEVFEGTYGVKATKESVGKQGLKDLKNDPNYRQRRKTEREEARQFARQKGEVARIKQRDIEGRGERGTAIANLLAAGITTGSTYFGSRLTTSANERISRGEDTTRQSAFGSALSAGGTAAGVGLSAGFALGGPVGAAIGGAALGIPTAIYSFTTALKTASDALENVKFDNAFDKLDKQIQNVLIGKLSAGNTISTTNSFFRDTEKSYLSGSLDVRTNIRSNIQGKADNFEALFSKIADTTKTFADFEKVTGNSLNVFSRISDIPYSELKKKIEDQIKANEKLATFSENLSEAFREQAIRVNNINDLLGAIAYADVKQSDISQSLDRLAGFSGTGSSSQTLGSRAGLIDAAKDGRGDLSGFNRLVRNISGNIGGPSIGVGQEAVFSAQIAKELPNILLGLQKGNPLDAGGGIIDQLGDALNKIAKDVGYSGIELQKSILNSAAEILGTSEDEGKLIDAIQNDLNGTVSKLANGLGNSADVFKELVSTIDNSVNQLKKGFADYYSIIDKSIELESKKQDVLFSAFQTRNSFYDVDTLLSSKLNFNQRKIGLISGQANNSPAALGQTIYNSQSNISRLDQLIKNNLGGSNQVKLESLRATEVNNLNNAIKALEELATSSDSLSAIQDEIAKEQEKNKLKKEGLNTLVFGNKDQKKDLAKQILLTAFAAKNPAGLKAIPENLRGNVKDFIDKAGKSNIFGERADELGKRLTKQAGIEAGVNGNIAEQLVSGITPAINELIKKFDEQVKIQTDAIQQQIGITKSNAENLKSALIDANKLFLDNLQKIFAENEQARKNTRDIETKNNISVLERQIGIRNNLSRGIVNGVNIGTKNLANLTGAIPELERYGNLKDTKNKLVANKTLAKNLIDVTPVNPLNNEISSKNIDKLLYNIESKTDFKISERARERLQYSDFNGNKVNLDKGYVNQIISNDIEKDFKSQIESTNINLEESVKTLSELGVNSAALNLPLEKLNVLIKNLSVGLGELNQISNPAGLEAKLRAENNKLGLASGGRVPGSGNYDSVPAMLTPGEFVLRKSAVQAIGLENLYEMNNIQRFAKGGSVKDRIAARIANRQAYIAKLKQGFADRKSGKYRPQYHYGFNPNAPAKYDMNSGALGINGRGTAQANKAISREQYQSETAYTPTRRRRFATGGLVEGNTSFDTSFVGRFDSVLKSFSGSVDRLVNSLQSLNGMTITMKATHDVNVVFNGAETLGRLMPELRDLAVTAAKQEINKMIDSKFPDVGRV